MKLYIKIENGNPVGHPIAAENYKQCFPEHNIENIPNGYALFERVEKPNHGIYEFCSENSNYIWEGDVVKDYWEVRPFTDKEKSKFISDYKSRWYNGDEYKKNPSWIFSEELCEFIPPVPFPQNLIDSLSPNQYYDWDEESISWVIKTRDIEFAPEWPMVSPF